MSSHPKFLFVTCQTEAGAAVKHEFAARWPDFRFAFSRPGFLTFRLPDDHHLRDDFDPGTVFARCCGFSLGKVAGQSTEAMAKAAWEVYGPRPVRRIHVWPRDSAEPGVHGFEPMVTPQCIEVHELLKRHCPRPESVANDLDYPRQSAGLEDMVLDCVLVEPDEWWIGCHKTHSQQSRWPGGLMPLTLPAEAVSRAWLKMEEGLDWSGLPIPRGAHVAEIGSAPGGASQSLLGRGFVVLGVDPAAMDKAVLAHPNFTHLRRRSTQVKRREFRKVRWLTADMNVAPNYTLDAVEAIVTHPEVSIRGLLLTLKLVDWSLAMEVGAYLDRVRSWGFNIVRARQLQHNRAEICVSALQHPFQRKW